MYYEMEHKQVCWGTFKDRKLTIGGDWCWRSDGVTIYNPTKDQANKTIVPHRFAIRPTDGTPRTRLRRDRYYLHVYKKIGS